MVSRSASDSITAGAEAPRDDRVAQPIRPPRTPSGPTSASSVPNETRTRRDNDPWFVMEPSSRTAGPTWVSIALILRRRAGASLPRREGATVLARVSAGQAGRAAPIGGGGPFSPTAARRLDRLRHRHQRDQ